MAVGPLIDRLLVLKAQRNLSTRALAGLIGVDVATCSRVLRRKNGPSERFLSGAFRAFPELHFFYAQVLQKTNGSVGE